MVDRLKTTELVSQGAGVFAFSQTSRIDSAYVKQLSCSIITTIQASLILLSVVFFCYTGNKTLVRLAIYATPIPKDACTTSYEGPECLLWLGWQIGPNN